MDCNVVCEPCPTLNIQVSELTGLERLNLGHNLLKKVEGVKGLLALVHLDLSSNQVCVKGVGRPRGAYSNQV